MEKSMVYASQSGAILNSNVYTGGGDDDTETLQKILDRAPALGRLHLVLDGAARTSKELRIHSNTTIECPDKTCGIFLSDEANSSVLCNADPDKTKIKNTNISLLGGVYNHNSPGQQHHVGDKWIIAMEFHGVSHMNVNNVTIANQRTFAFIMSNFKYVTMENIHIDRRHRIDEENQDGLHFWGPGRFLTLRNIYGNSGDDFIALAPDEFDGKSEITDVLIDGVHLDDADQGIRLLSNGDGLLDRVVIKNVTGTYRSYGFIINPWVDGGFRGKFGNIIFDTIDLRPMKNNYDYSPPFLFKIGGQIDNLVIKNLYHHNPQFNHSLFILGGDHGEDKPEDPEKPTHIHNLLVQGLYIQETDESGIQDAYFRIKSRVESLVLQDVRFIRSKAIKQASAFIRVEDNAEIEELCLRNVSLPASLRELLDVNQGNVRHFDMDAVKK